MIGMLISSMSEKETGYICVRAKDMMGSMSDEMLEIHKCQTIEMLKKIVDSGEKADLACIDITIPEALELTKLFRSKNETAYIILIASLKISPVTYMKPSIRAESLILKPFQSQQVDMAVKEAIQEVLKKYQNPDIDKVFVVDNQEGRVLIEYSAIYLNTGAREYGFYSTIEQLQEELGEQFIRCHRGFLVNQKKIERVVFAKNLLILTDGYEIPVSRTYKSILKEFRTSV